LAGSPALARDADLEPMRPDLHKEEQQIVPTQPPRDSDADRRILQSKRLVRADNETVD
jgi:hypothetical protein